MDMAFCSKCYVNTDVISSFHYVNTCFLPLLRIDQCHGAVYQLQLTDNHQTGRSNKPTQPSLPISHVLAESIDLQNTLQLVYVDTVCYRNVCAH